MSYSQGVQKNEPDLCLFMCVRENKTFNGMMQAFDHRLDG